MALGLHSLGKVKTDTLTTLGQPPTKTKREKAASALEGLIRNLAAGVVAAEASGGVGKLREGVKEFEAFEGAPKGGAEIETVFLPSLLSKGGELISGMLPSVLPERIRLKLTEQSSPEIVDPDTGSVSPARGPSSVGISATAPLKTLTEWFAREMTSDELQQLVPLAEAGIIRQTGGALAPLIEEAILGAAVVRGFTAAGGAIQEGLRDDTKKDDDDDDDDDELPPDLGAGPTDAATAESIASAQEQLAAFSALTPPEIGEFAFTPSGRGAAAGESQLAASRTAIEEEARKAKIQGFAQLAEAGRRGGAVTSFETALAAEKAGALGKAELEASQTRLGIEIAERGQSLKEFIGQKEADLSTFDTQAAASASALAGFIDSARTGAEIVQGDIALFVKNVDSTFQIALARKALGIQKQVAAGQLDIEKGRQAIQAEKVRLEGLQNDLKAQLQPDVIEGLKDKATADKWAGRVSTILGMAGLGFALGGPWGAAGGAAAGVVTAFAPEIFG